MTGNDELRDQQPGADPAERAADRALTSYAETVDETPSPGFSDWVMRSVASEPLPRRGWLASLGLLLATPGPSRRLAQAGVAVLVLAVAVGMTYGIARVGGLLPDETPPPSVSPVPSPSWEPMPTPDGSATPAPSASPEASDDEDDTSESPEPSDPPRPTETPRPSETPEPSDTPDPSD